jgi:hypothetical protein
MPRSATSVAVFVLTSQVAGATMSTKVNSVWAGFKSGKGLASPALILVWLGVGVGATWIAWSLTMAGVEFSSGTVQAVRTDPKFGTHVSIDSSSTDFFMDSIEFPDLPDVRVGDRVELLTDRQPDGWVIAVQSARGYWSAKYHGGHASLFTPGTWWLHDFIAWSLVTAGVVVALFGLVSLVRWISSTQQQSSPAIAATQAELLQPQVVARALPPEPGLTIPKSAPLRFNRASVAVVIGVVCVTIAPLLEVVGVSAGLGSCSNVGATTPLLIAITTGVLCGGVAVLVLAATTAKEIVRRATARRLGVVALLIGGITVPVNFVVIGLSAFCAVG